MVSETNVFPAGIHKLTLTNRNLPGTKMTLDRVNVCSGSCDAMPKPRIRLAPNHDALCGRPQLSLLVDNCAELVAQGAVVNWVDGPHSLGRGAGCNMTQVFEPGEHTFVATASTNLPCRKSSQSLNITIASAPLPPVVIVAQSCLNPVTLTIRNCTAIVPRFHSAVIEWFVDDMPAGRGCSLTRDLDVGQIVSALVHLPCPTVAQFLVGSDFFGRCVCTSVGLV